jgi:hypothetical protein
MRNKAKQRKEETLARLSHKWSGKLESESTPLKEADKLAFVVIDRMRNPHGVSMRKDSNGAPFVRIVDSLGIRSHSPEHDREEVRGAIALSLVQSGHFETEGARVNFPELFTVARKALCMTSTQEEGSEADGQNEAASPWSAFAFVHNSETRAKVREYRKLISFHAERNQSRKAKTTYRKNRDTLAGLVMLARGIGFADIRAFRHANGEVKAHEDIRVQLFRFREDINEAVAILRAEKARLEDGETKRADAIEKADFAEYQTEQSALPYFVCPAC